MFVTIVEGVVDPEREDDLRAEWERRRSELPVGLVESLLLRGEKSDTWRIVSLWESREAVMAMRDSGERPGALAMFEEAGADPAPSFWNVEDHASPDQPRAGSRGS